MAMLRSPRVLGIVGSVRSLYPAEEFERDLLRLGTFDDAYNHIYGLASRRRICNTDGAMIAACFGAAEQGASVSVARLPDLLGDGGDAEAGRRALLEAVAKADGLIVGTPVYFGDRSSFVERLFNLLEEQGDLPLKGKSLGFVSVGAKRNGGQETTNILGLNDAMGLGANVVGNGPPTSQYGGTAVAGDLGAVLDDNHGLLSSYGTGGRVARVASLPKLSKAAAAPPRLLAVYTATPPEEQRQLLRDSLPKGVVLEELFLDQHELGHCLACHTCPHPNALKSDHPCIQRGGMVEIRRRLLAADGIVLVGAFTGTRSLTHYQLFAERTRFIRRHDFELANVPLGLVVLARPGGGQNFPLRATNLALRHNMIVVGPGYTGHLDHGRVRPSLRGLTRYLRHLASQAQRYRLTRQLWQGHDLYEAVGYAH